LKKINRKKTARIISLLVLAMLFFINKAFRHQDFLSSDFQDKTHLVDYVVDGDTVRLSSGENVRYIGVDTPETRERKSGGWVYKPMPFAEEAKAFNKKLVEGRRARLEFDVQKKDRYGRLLAYVYVDDKMVNLDMIREGYATIYTYPPNVKYAERFLEAQREARASGKGLWVDVGEAIPASEAKDNIGKVKVIEAEVVDTYISDKMLVLKFKGGFKVVMFKDMLFSLPNKARRSPDSYFRGKTIRVYGAVKDYKGSPEIVLGDPSQIEICLYSRK